MKSRLFSTIPIHSEDDMFHGSYEHYHAVGAQMAKFVSHAAELISNSSPFILELPSGHGRVTRKLVDKFGSSNVYVGEILPHALKFCQDSFDVHGYQIAEPIYEFRNIPDSKFDIAVMGSLITHLSEQDSRTVIKFFFNKVKQGGVGIITTHGIKSRQLLDKADIYQVGEKARTHLITRYDDNQFGFSFYSNNHTHEKRTVSFIGNTYGISLIPECWIAKVCEVNGLSIIKHLPAGWDSHQDVFFISKN